MKDLNLIEETRILVEMQRERVEALIAFQRERFDTLIESSGLGERLSPSLRNRIELALAKHAAGVRQAADHLEEKLMLIAQEETNEPD